LSLAYFAALIAVVAVSALQFVDAEFGRGLGMAAASIALLAVSVEGGRSDKEHLLRVVGGLRWGVALLLAGITAQLLPVPLSIAHPIWADIRDALAGMPFGYLTADVSATLSCLFLALALVTLTCVTIVVCRDRRRAELMLLVLTGVTGCAALFADIRPLAAGGPRHEAAGLTAVFAGFGLVLSVAVVQLALERAETRRVSFALLVIGFSGIAGIAIDGTAVLFLFSLNTAVAGLIALALSLLILTIRRLGLSTLAAAALATTTLFGAAIVLAWIFEKTTGPALLQLVPALGESEAAALRRMLTDARWYGAGIGAFQSVGHIYQNADSLTPLTAPSAAVALFVGAGWIGLIATAATAGAIIWRLVMGALRRGRDSFFATAAAGCVLFCLLQIFVGPGLLTPAALLVLSAVAGLGLSQSVSQSPRSQH
jgi:hypothetical protein